MRSFSVLCDCIIEPRNDQTEPLFDFHSDGRAFIHLKGYAIIPIETYEELFRKAGAADEEEGKNSGHDERNAMIRAKNLRQLQTRLTARLDTLAGKMMSGALTPSQFLVEAESLLSYSHSQAAFWGTARANRTGSVDIAARVARDATEEQRSFLFGFVRDLAENRYGLRTQGGEGASRRMARFALYSLRLNGSANEAWRQTLLAQEPLVEALWVRRATESCRDCLVQASYGWRPLRSIPFVPGSGRTACIVRCRCVLKTRQGEQSYIL